MEKRQSCNLEDVRKDMRAGLDNVALMRKHNLSEADLKAIFNDIIQDRFAIGDGGPTSGASHSTSVSSEHAVIPRFDAKALMFGKFGALGGAVGPIIGEVFYFRPSSFIGLLVNSVVFTSMIGVSLAICLFASQEHYLRKPRVWANWYRAIIPGVVAGSISGLVAQSLFSFIGPTEFLRVICWAVAGALLAFFLSRKIPNLDQKKAALGGLVGGAGGGLLFIIISVLVGSEVLARSLGGASIGFCIGIMVVVAETLTRTYWMEVRWPDGKLSNLSLGQKSITVGSAPECDVVHPSLPHLMCRIWADGNKINYEEQASKKVFQLQENEGVDLGDLAVSVRKVQALGSL